MVEMWFLAMFASRSLVESGMVLILEVPDSRIELDGKTSNAMPKLTSKNRLFFNKLRN